MIKINDQMIKVNDEMIKNSSLPMKLLNRKVMLYSRRSCGKFSDKFVLQKNGVKINHLFDAIFNSSLDSYFNTEIKHKLWPHLHHIIIRHKCCNYENLLHHHCPLEKGYFNIYQYELQSALDQYSTHKQVITFLYAVLYHIFPMELFGGKNNFEKLYHGLKLIITMGSFTPLYVHNLIYAIDFDTFLWLKDISNPQIKQMIGESLIF